MPADCLPALAAVRYEKDFDINRTLRSVVARLREADVKIGGVLQRSEILPNRRCARLYAVDIRTGKSECITQDRGSESLGCRLDPRGLADISHCIAEAMESRVDLIIVNKFGRAESEGGGLKSCIADAISAGFPVLTTVREPYVAAWNSFHGGLASMLAPRVEAICQWVDTSCRSRETVPTIVTAA
jgi:nucleoside-triphosphatase THEP1